MQHRIKKEGFKPLVGKKPSPERIIGVATAVDGFFYVFLQAVEKFVEIVKALL